jgi:predicted RecB family nuclease
LQRVDDRLLFSPSDLGGFLACEHLTQLELAVAHGEAARVVEASDYADLLRRKGQEHEQAYLASLRDAGRSVVEIGLGPPRDYTAGFARTMAAMRSGADYVYQAVFTADGWRGIADFLERVDRPSALGPFSYQVLDTKLARHPRPEHALQLSFYSQALARAQGLEPDLAYVVLGTRERAPIRLADVAAYYRHVRGRFCRAVEARPATGPYPCDHCSYCDFRTRCEARLEREDHLVRVAGMRRDHVRHLRAAGIDTLTSLATRTDAPATKIAPRTLAGLIEQAELQLHRHRTGALTWRVREVEPGRGFSALPPRAPGDLVLDFEGHPFFDPGHGLQYLFGALLLDGDTVV